MKVLITGGLGFVGSELTRSYLRRPDVERVILIVRPHAGLSGMERVRRQVEHWARFVDVPRADELEKLQIVEADLDQLKGRDAAALGISGSVELFIHAAASTELGEALGPSRRANLFSTQKALQLARTLSGLQRFLHFSTAYVCGRKRGVIREDDPPTGRFHNFYEQTKRESEDAVRCSGLPFTILRPSIIVGRSDDGYLPRSKVLYSVWRMWLSGHVPRAPLDPKAWVDLVPIDFVVDATMQLALHPGALGRSLHLCAGADRQSPTTIMNAATTVFQVPRPPLSPPWVARALRARIVKPFVPHALREILDVMYWHLPYLGIRGRLFDMQTSDALLAPAKLSCPKFADFGGTLFQFCRETAWGKRPRRTGAAEASNKREISCTALAWKAKSPG